MNKNNLYVLWLLCLLALPSLAAGGSCVERSGAFCNEVHETGTCVGACIGTTNPAIAAQLRKSESAVLCSSLLCVLNLGATAYWISNPFGLAVLTASSLAAFSACTVGMTCSACLRKLPEIETLVDASNRDRREGAIPAQYAMPPETL